MSPENVEHFDEYFDGSKTSGLESEAVLNGCYYAPYVDPVSAVEVDLRMGSYLELARQSLEANLGLHLGVLEDVACSHPLPNLEYEIS